MRSLSVILICVFLFSFISSHSQISKGGVPKSFEKVDFQSGFQTVELYADPSLIVYEDPRESGSIGPYKIGFNIETNLTPKNSGTWFTLDNGDKLWKLEIQSSGAQALVVYYRDFKLPEGAELFLYNKTKSQVIGAFTKENNPVNGYFANEMIQGDVVIIEYYVLKQNANHIPFTISEIGYIYRNSSFLKYKDFGGSNECEVNVNCPEGQNWQKQKRGVALIQLKEGSSVFFCSGSLINNTKYDLTPYFLTANHCGEFSSTVDYEQWVFKFNYESEGCNSPLNEPVANTMTGSQLIARPQGPILASSDFKLLLLNQNVPVEYNPYFNGWSILENPSSSGVGIHHPDGDIKKISTYNTQQLLSTDFDSHTFKADGLYWKVIWDETESGYGHTEGGSSGSPLFNANGQIVGTLTGGPTVNDCLTISEPYDYYGKFSYSWVSDGTSNDEKLQPWLDPDNIGVESLNGLGYGDIILIPKFESDTIVPLGGSLNFTDLSEGSITQWEWTFEGGTPSSSMNQNPQSIVYNTLGKYDVTLKVSNSNTDSTLTKEDYITVVSHPKFESDTIVPIGHSLDFTDLSVGAPIEWEWTFEGGVPNTSNIQNPQWITYHSLGTFDVKLRIQDENFDTTLVKEDYIKVIPIIGPIPSTDEVTIYLGSSPVDNVIFTIYDQFGKELEKLIIETPIEKYVFSLAKYKSGLYFIKVKTPNTIHTYKVIIL